ncbi:MAG TPA: redox-sensing transcriptional repressor Rex [Phycisphaerales bacterium]|nr:redox-sensing transcriptional repressor Rex [Phycisphaerales bacterium]
MVANRACIVRLSTYKNALLRLQSLGFKKVFSDNLADAAGVTAAQVRKDFSMFGITGNRRAGYRVEGLIEQIREVLGKNKIHKVIVVGAGRIGEALIRYRGFEAGGIQVAAAFDIDPAKFDADGAVPVLPLEQLTDFVAEQGVELAILAVPDIAAQQVAQILASAGIRGILNFAPIQLRLGPDVVVGNINLELELENLIYFISAGRKARTP